LEICWRRPGMGRRFRLAAERDGNVIPAPTTPGSRDHDEMIEMIETRRMPGQLARPTGAPGKTKFTSGSIQSFERRVRMPSAPPSLQAAESDFRVKLDINLTKTVTNTSGFSSEITNSRLNRSRRRRCASVLRLNRGERRSVGPWLICFLIGG
jgi:hypothetical protein